MGHKTKINKGIQSFWILAIAFVMSWSTPAHARIIFQDDSFADVDSEGILLDALDQATGNITIQFGNALGEFIQWNAADLRFEVSDDIDFNSHELIEARLENAAALPGGAGGPGAGQEGRVIHLTAADIIAPGCSPLCAPGTYVWNGTAWESTTSALGHVVTVGTGADYTTIADAATYLNSIGGGQMLLGAETYTISTVVDLENIEIIGHDPPKSIISLTGAGQIQAFGTKFKDVRIALTAGLAATFGIDLKYSATSETSVQFEYMDFEFAAGKILMDSTAGTPPKVTALFANATQSTTDGLIIDDIATANIDTVDTNLIMESSVIPFNQALDFSDWTVIAIDKPKVATDGGIITDTLGTVYIHPGMNIQGAINSITGLGVDGRIELLAGDHLLTAPLLVTSDIIIEGQGNATVMRAPSGTWTGGLTVDDAVIQVGTADGATPANNVKIKHFKLEVEPDIHGIQVNGGNDILVQDMLIESIGAKTTRRTGLVFTDAAASAGTRFQAIKNLISHSAAVNRWNDSMHVDGNADFVGSVFGYGNGVTDSTFTENTFFESNAAGVIMTEVSASTFTDNKFRDASFLGFINLILNDVQDGAFANNSFEGDQSGSTGILLVDNVDNSTFTNNKFRGGPSPFTIGINNAAATNEDNIFTNNQFETVTTPLSEAGANTKLETNHHRAITAPTVTDDITLGYSIGTLWVDTVTNITYMLVDHTAGAAIWAELDYTEASATPPIACTATFAGKTFMDTDTGIVYVCDTSNGRNKWLSQDEKIIFGEETGACNAGLDLANDDGCTVDWGNSLGPETATNLGFYIRHPITITGVGFSQDDDACTTGSFDLEVWSTGSNANDNNYTLESTIATGLTAETHNAGGLNFDVAGDQYIIWGIDNNCGQSIDDWNMVLYFRHRHN